MTAQPLRNPLQLFEQYLTERGLTKDDVVKLGWFLGSPEDLSNILGYRVHCSGIIIPYPGESYSRVRVLGASRGGAKYLSPRNSGCAPPYFPPGPDWHDIKADVSIDICIPEGEVKSYCGTRTGEIACVGIGGVDMQATLFTKDIEWRNRRVFICFDKDAGYETGTYKPGVGRAIGRLASSLSRVGAQVLVMHIPGAANDKLGLDDYLLAGGQLNDLAGSATAPPEWCEDLAWMLEHCIYVTGTDKTHFYNMLDGSKKTPDDFHAAHIGKIRVNDKGKVQQISRIFQRHQDLQIARGYTLDPSRPPGLNGHVDINQWTPYPVWPERDESVRSDWQKFMEGLFGEHWQWVGAWVGHMLVRPEEKSMQAVLLITQVLGIGKGLFSEIVGKIVGEDHYTECLPENMFNSFNSEMEGRSWVAIHELDVSFSAKVGQINNLITSEKMGVRRMRTDMSFVPDLRRIYMTTNSTNPMRLSHGQRRIFVIRPPRTHEDTRGPWGTWVREAVAKWKRSGAALGSIREWFEGCLAEWEEKKGRWDPTEPVPETEEGEEVAEASMTVGQILAQAAIDHMRTAGWGCVSPDNRRLMTKVYGDIGAAVKASGGQVLRHKLVESVGGPQKEYTIYDLTGRLPKRFKESNRTSYYAGDIPKEEIVMSGVRLWQVLRDLNDQLKGHAPLKGQG